MCGGALTAEGSTKFRNVNEIEENTSPKIVRTPISKALLLMVFSPFDRGHSELSNGLKTMNDLRDRDTDDYSEAQFP